MDRGSWHRIGGRDQDHPQEKEMQKGKMIVWGGLTNSCEKKRNERQRRKGKIYLSEWRVPKNIKEISFSVVPFSSCLQSFPASGSSKMSQFFTSGGQSIGFSFNISPFNEYSGLIFFRMDWLDLLAVQGTHKSLFQRHSSKVPILQCSALFMVQLSHLYMTTGKTKALTRWTFVANNVSAF